MINLHFTLCNRFQYIKSIYHQERLPRPKSFILPIICIAAGNSSSELIPMDDDLFLTRAVSLLAFDFEGSLESFVIAVAS
jgi:hypothetical protein